MQNTTNPLADRTAIATLNVDFSALTPRHFREILPELVTAAQKEFRAWCKRFTDVTPASYDEYDDVPAIQHLQGVISLLSMMNSLRSDPEYVEIEMNELSRAYNVYQEIAASKVWLDVTKRFKASIIGADVPKNYVKCLDDVIDSAKLSGVDLPDDKKRQLAKLVNKLGTLGSKFRDNLNSFDASVSLTFTEVELDGISERAKSMMSKDEAGNFVATMYNGGLNEIAQYANSEAVRKRVYEARVMYGTSSGMDNRPIIKKIVALRKQICDLLGYDNHATMTLERKMAKDVDTVTEFLDTFKTKLIDKAATEAKEFTAMGRKILGRKMMFWDRSYAMNKWQEQVCGFDESVMREYFTIDSVKAGVFALLCELFDGLAFTKLPAGFVPTWHEDVEVYVLPNGRKLYLDLFSRPGKSSGAWMNPLCGNEDVAVDSGCRLTTVSSALVACNFDRGADGTCTLLHYDVLTLMHEFGHALQHLLTEVHGPYNGIAGIEWDAVELASQFMENFCWDHAVLNGFAVKPIPKDLYDKKCKERSFRAASSLMWQIRTAIMDMRIHVRHEDPAKIEAEVDAEMTFTPKDKRSRYLPTLGHIFDGGYAAGLYSYLWAEVMSTDCFGAVEEARQSNFFSDGAVHAVMKKYRDLILSTGGVESMRENFKNFRGRDPRVDFLLSSYGLN